MGSTCGFVFSTLSHLPRLFKAPDQFIFVALAKRLGQPRIGSLFMVLKLYQCLFSFFYIFINDGLFLLKSGESIGHRLEFFSTATVATDAPIEGGANLTCMVSGVLNGFKTKQRSYCTFDMSHLVHPASFNKVKRTISIREKHLAEVVRKVWAYVGIRI